MDMDQYPVMVKNPCDYSSLTFINRLITEDRFIHVRDMIREKTPFGELLKMDQKLKLNANVGFHAVKAWNGEKLVIGKKEYEIDSELVKKSLGLSITGNRIIKPRYDNYVPVFIEKTPEMSNIHDRKKFNSLLVAIFRSKDGVKVIDETHEVIKFSKLYTALLFSALLFPKSKRIPFEYFHLLDDRHFCNLKLYKFDIEVAKFLRDGITTAKNAKTKYATVGGCLHIVDCLYSQERLPMSPIKSRRERLEREVELDESPTDLHRPFSSKRVKSNIRNCYEEYPLKEPQSENIDTEDGSSEDGSSEDGSSDEDDEALTDDKVQFEEVCKYSLMTPKRELVETVTPSPEYMNAGQQFEGKDSCDGVALDAGKFEVVGGFHVLKTQAKFISLQAKFLQIIMPKFRLSQE